MDPGQIAGNPLLTYNGVMLTNVLSSNWHNQLFVDYGAGPSVHERDYVSEVLPLAYLKGPAHSGRASE